MTWRALLERLVAARLVPAEQIDGLHAWLREPANQPRAVPWMVRVMVGIGAWIAGCFLIGSVTACMGLVFGADHPGLLTGFGLTLLGAGVGMRLKVPGVFAGQIALSVGAAGQLLLGAGLAAQHGLTSQAVAWLIISTALVLVHPDPVQRFASTLVSMSSVGILADRAAHAVSGELTLLVVTSLLLAVVFVPEAALGSRLSAMRAPVRLGLVVSLLMASLAAESADVARELGAGDGVPSFLLAPLVVGAGLLVAAWRALARYGVGLASEPGALAIGTTLALAALGQGRAGLLGAMLAMVASFAAHDKVAVGLSTTFLVGFGVHFYYDLDLTLWAKSGVLVGSGVTLLLVRAWLHHRRYLAEAA